MGVIQTVIGPDGESRIPCALPTEHMTTYQLAQPLATHYRQQTCQEAECANFHNGWEMGYDLTDELKVEAANLLNHIAKKRDMKFTTQVLGTVVTFTFAAGNQCFESHYEPLERDPFAIKRNGDWRGNPRKETYTHTNLDDWVDDFANHQIEIAERTERG